jgi:tripartite-type tricarboxylate transporter receptor subunit TctC
MRVLFALILTILASSAHAECALRFAVPYAPGSTADVQARVYADAIGRVLKRETYVENKTPGIVGVLSLLKAPHDGCTVGIISSSLLIKRVWQNAKDASPADFRYSTYLAKGSLYLVVPATSPVHTLGELIAKKPKSYAAPSPGAQNNGPPIEALLKTGANMINLYSGGEKDAVADLASGRVDFGYLYEPTVAIGVAAGTIRAIAVVDAKRSPYLPQVPTIGEALSAVGKPVYEPLPVYVGAVFPPGTPAAVVEQFSRAACVATHDPWLLAKFKGLWSQAVCSTPQEFRAHALKYMALF